MRKDSGSYDVVVVGAGLAGHCAALEAATAGASALLIEKMSAFGGTTAMCGGAFAFAGTEIQKRMGIADSPALLENDLLKCGNFLNDPEIVHVYAERQYEAYRWLEGIGLVFDSVSLNAGQSVPRLHSLDPRRILEILHRAVLGKGVHFRSNAGVKRLLTQGEDAERRVTGVQLHDGERVPARGGVVIATGGFSRAPDLVARFAPHLRNAKPMGGMGNTGDGLRMGWALGADLLDMTFTKGTFGAPVAAPLPGKEHLAPLLVSTMYKGSIVVNLNGRRFVNESLSYKDIGDECLKQPEAIGIQIFDQAIMDQSAPFPTVDDYQSALGAGVIKRSETLEGLARVLGISAEALQLTVQRHNAVCSGAADDEFGRAFLSSGYGKPPPISKPGFYGVPCTTGLTSTYSGLRTDARSRVVDVFGDAIPGLYAAGEVMGGLHVRLTSPDRPSQSVASSAGSRRRMRFAAPAVRHGAGQDAD